MVLTPLQLPSVQHNPSCDGCARDAEENRTGVAELRLLEPLHAAFSAF